MLLALLIFNAVVLLALVVYVVVDALATPARALEQRRRRRVVVHTDRGSIRGVLDSVHADCVVIVHPEFLAGAEPAGVGGEVLIPLERIQWWQALPPTSDRQSDRALRAAA